MTQAARAFVVVAVLAIGVGAVPMRAEAQATAGAGQERTPLSSAELQAAITQLGSFDYATRTDAARRLRRAPQESVVPALAAAARNHPDSYAQFRALVILSGFGGSTATAVMKDVLANRNDRLREVAYSFFSRHPEPDVLPQLIAALDKEQSEFVRPALTRAIAAQHTDPRARAAIAPLVMRGEDFFRGAVIAALGDFGGAFALPDIVEVARLDGPLQDDAITALGKLGDRAAVPELAALQKSAPPEVQPTIAAALCLLGMKCDDTDEYLRKMIAFGAASEVNQRFVRGAAHALGLLAAAGRESALRMLFDAGIGAKDPVQSPIALAIGLVALRNPDLLMRVLEARPDRDQAVGIVRDAFDMLTEDFEEEQFFAAVRRTYWAAPADSPRRAVALLLIDKLEF